MNNSRSSGAPLLPAGLIALILLPALALLALPFQSSLQLQFGENDFIEYWTAYQLHVRNADPYNPVLVYAVERAQGWQEPKPLMMWNPPWTLSILAPILAFPLKIAARIFLGLNVAMLFISALLVLDARGSPPRVRPLAILFAFCSIPAYFTLMLGQLSILLTAALSALYWSLKKERWILAGISGAILTIKPHVLFLVLLAVSYRLFQDGTWKRILPPFLISLLCLVAFLFVHSGNTLFYWLERGQHAGHPLLVEVLHWRTTSLASLFRDTFTRSYGVFWPKLIFLIPGIAALLLILILIRTKPRLDWDLVFPGLIPLSCSLAAFCWIFDAAVCCLTQVTLASLLLEKAGHPAKRLLPLLLLLGLQVFMVIHIGRFHSGYQEFWYYAPLLFALWVITQGNPLKTKPAEK